MTVRKRIVISPLLLFLAAANGIVFAQQDAGRVDLPSVFDHLESQVARIRDLESRLERQSQPVQMLPAVHETHRDLADRVDALEAASRDRSDDDGWLVRLFDFRKERNCMAIWDLNTLDV